MNYTYNEYVGDTRRPQDLSNEALYELISNGEKILDDVRRLDEDGREIMLQELYPRLNELQRERIRRTKLQKLHQPQQPAADPAQPNRDRKTYTYLVDTVDGKGRRLTFYHRLPEILSSLVLADGKNPDGWIEDVYGDLIHTGKIVYISKINEEEALQ